VSAPPSIAVVIPSHNRPEPVGGALASVRAQTSPPDAVVVVDDGSQPPLQLPAEPGLTLLRNHPAAGANAARNCGWRAAGTDYVAFLDDDDRFATGKIAAVREALDRDPLADVVYHCAQITMVNEGVAYRTGVVDLGASTDPYRDLLIRNGVGGTPMVTVRTAMLRQVGGFDEQLGSMQDYDLWLRLAQAGARFHYVDEPLTLCRYVTAGGGISTNVEKHFLAAQAIEAKHVKGYALLSPAQRRAHQAFVINVATHRALMAGDTARARALQRDLLRVDRSPRALANAAVTALGPKAAFRVRSMLDRGPTAAARGSTA
jgi:glycosyltransferase involved in cell wall biosynthesis